MNKPAITLLQNGTIKIAVDHLCQFLRSNKRSKYLIDTETLINGGDPIAIPMSKPPKRPLLIHILMQSAFFEIIEESGVNNPGYAIVKNLDVSETNIRKLKQVIKKIQQHRKDGEEILDTLA